MRAAFHYLLADGQHGVSDRRLHDEHAVQDDGRRAAAPEEGVLRARTVRRRLHHRDHRDNHDDTKTIGVHSE